MGRRRSHASAVPGDWAERAACRGVDDEIFFPPGVDGSHKGRPPTARMDKDWEDARAVCRRCPVRLECLEFALATGQEYGMWGGLTPPERRAEAAQRQRSRTSTGVCVTPS